MPADDTKAEDLLGVPLPATTRARSLELAAGGRYERRLIEIHGRAYRVRNCSRRLASKDVGAGATAEAVQLDHAYTAIEVELLDDTGRVSSLAHGLVDYQRTLTTRDAR